MPTAIFDLDGTLVDTSIDMIAAANTVFTALGYAPPLDAAVDAGTAFAGGRAMLETGAQRCGFDWSQPDYARAYTHFIAAYSDALDVGSVVYPDVEDAIEDLKRSGWIVGICTNKPAGLAERLTTSLGLRHRFGALVGADTLPVRKPDPAPLWETVDRAGGDRAACVLVGDTVTDLTTARNAGVASVLVTFGPRGHAVADWKPDGLLHDYAGLGAALDALELQG